MNEFRPFRQSDAARIGHIAKRKANGSPFPRITIALAIVAAIVAVPSHFTDVSELRFPLEVAAVALLASVLTGSGFSLLRWAVTLLAAAMLFLKLADIGTGTAFQRPFNPYLDLKILTDGWNLLSGAVGVTEAVGIICVGLLAWLIVAAVLYWLLGGFRGLSCGARRISLRASGAVLLIGLVALVVQTLDRRSLGVEAHAASYFVNRVTMVKQSIADLARFEEELRQDPVSAGPHFSALAGTDVVLVFIESYGRSAIEDPRYAARVGSRLASVEKEIGAVGLQARSGWLTSPTVGGISWLAHGTLLSGLWVDNQGRYDRLITSERKSLNNLFRSSGWRTTAVMPAITLDWSEAGYFGYDSIHAAAGLGYRGKPFNWVTMPDQFTLEAFERLERQARDERGHKPVMAEMALISSHAPWTPIPSLIPWDKVGDGAAFNSQAESGDPPSVVWADPNRVRAQYLTAIDYTLETLGSYMARYGRNTLFILLGDHQPASIVTGEGASRDVPMHIVTGNPDLLKRLDGWNWQKGMLPQPSTPVYRMDEFRRKLVESFD
ncbi:sulfatase-like hydrolase/transferase [Neorhizobium galegae]|uniref:sulfatase-like hydrolase/transferase n=1 Tax=Neorhizobium galegae TaxID=399 RepID=UPI0006225B60|nr:sulfatase-like hydrolase/transferase [Neorhizobium galegae]CDZ29857.1 CDP-alcohol phosphatidyltransferase [Neorhizobium galegae bv. officinalis]KAA9385224.1 sulfatase [Neorhizobium galegae]KAB1112049.1 sulfatase [Neorhizobium galegae]MCM2500423.1 sulfatase [Neorhizobium galegae]MCQ1772013.1 sulfatase [Neorhizobium galegae]